MKVFLLLLRIINEIERNQSKKNTEWIILFNKYLVFKFTSGSYVILPLSHSQEFSWWKP